MLTVNISPILIMTQTCNDKLYYKKTLIFFLKINENMLKMYFKVAAILNNTMLRLYINLLIPEMKLRVLNIDVLLKKVSIPDGSRFI